MRDVERLQRAGRDDVDPMRRLKAVSRVRREMRVAFIENLRGRAEVTAEDVELIAAHIEFQAALRVEAKYRKLMQRVCITALREYDPGDALTSMRAATAAIRASLDGCGADE